MPGRDPGGCIITVLLGIAGALVAGWIGHAVGWYSENEGAGFIAAIVGALILLLLYRVIAGRRAGAVVQQTAMAAGRPMLAMDDLPGEQA
jgi:uncharacterized membrane protein YeaQ/YmgE (transglycosylase-associated protein family)